MLCLAWSVGRPRMAVAPKVLTGAAAALNTQRVAVGRVAWHAPAARTVVNRWAERGAQAPDAALLTPKE